MQNGNFTLRVFNMGGAAAARSNGRLRPASTGRRRRCNLPELISIFKEAADIQTSDMLNLREETPSKSVEPHAVKEKSPTPKPKVG